MENFGKDVVMSLLNSPVNGLSVSYSSGRPSGSINYCQAVDNSYKDAVPNALGTIMTTAGAANATYIYPNTQKLSLWDYWSDHYYPWVIKESYPVWMQERSMDKGKQAFELVKALMDKKLLKVDSVKDFVEAMDVVLKTI